MTWQEFLDILFCSSCKKQNLELLDKWQECQGFTRTQAATITKLEKQNEQLKLLVPRPTPPEIDYVVEKDTLWVQSVLMGLSANLLRLPLDGKYRLTDKDNFLDIIAWDWIDSRKYVSEVFDCENFAIAFKSHVDEFFGLNQVGIVIDYKAGHSYNLVVFPDGKVMLIEPQADQLFYWVGEEAQMYIFKESIVII